MSTIFDALSSNGKSADFESVNLGSSPRGHPKIRYIIDNALIAQLVEHITCNDGVRRSSRRGGTRIKRTWYNGITLAFQADDTGSIPVARSKFISR